MDSILIVDDNHAICQALSLMLELNGYHTISAENPAQALVQIQSQSISLVIQDMNFTKDTTSGEEGKELFYAIRELEPDLPIILMTAWTQLELAVELVRSGAADYIGKPWDDDKLLTSVNNLTSLSQAKAQNQQLTRVDAERMAPLNDADLCGTIFASGNMQRCIDLALQVAKADVSVLITGPNGAGKDKIADIIHANSPLKDKPLIKVNIGALPMDLLEAELFGAEAGAFTGANKTRIGRFEAADGGTLFLDEIGNLPLSGQVKLLRVLQTGEFERLGSHQTRKVNVRVLSATNADLQQDIESGKFREDLFYRLNVIELKLPPLNQRLDDIIPLVNHFIGSDFKLNKPTTKALQQHSWPGNVRELENACKRAIILAQSPELIPEDFGLTAVATSHSKPSNNKSNQVQPELDKASIEALLIQHNGVIARAAKAVGLTRQSLYRRMEKLGIEKA
ncbi:sigma-54 dependent transcriptional regulator [Paraferrimonas sp. SM1919]|uniref:sigma-54-dependent transcriptional regulator n=1 Tax=Paraferrimonas sp. SM1919 TaxID=2662263 RepID=UPI0013CFF122|nr:sigma-54 dependent transcriptional regulator [Paraferrimonas sp. SM1919]